MRSTLWCELRNGLGHYQSPADTEISPREAHDAPKDVLQTHVLSSSLGVFTDINGHSLGSFVSNTRVNRIGLTVVLGLQRCAIPGSNRISPPGPVGGRSQTQQLVRRSCRI